MTTKPSPPVLINSGDAAKYIGVSVHTINVWRTQGKGPAFVRVGGLVRYRVADLDAFLDSGRVGAKPSAA